MLIVSAVGCGGAQLMLLVSTLLLVAAGATRQALVGTLLALAGSLFFLIFDHFSNFGFYLMD